MNNELFQLIYGTSYRKLLIRYFFASFLKLYFYLHLLFSSLELKILSKIDSKLMPKWMRFAFTKLLKSKFCNIVFTGLLCVKECITEVNLGRKNSLGLFVCQFFSGHNMEFWVLRLLQFVLLQWWDSRYLQLLWAVSGQWRQICICERNSLCFSKMTL